MSDGYPPECQCLARVCHTHHRRWMVVRQPHPACAASKQSVLQLGKHERPSLLNSTSPRRRESFRNPPGHPARLQLPHPHEYYCKTTHRRSMEIRQSAGAGAKRRLDAPAGRINIGAETAGWRRRRVDRSMPSAAGFARSSSSSSWSQCLVAGDSFSIALSAGPGSRRVFRRVAAEAPKQLPAEIRVVRFDCQCHALVAPRGSRSFAQTVLRKALFQE